MIAAVLPGLPAAPAGAAVASAAPDSESVWTPTQQRPTASLNGQKRTVSPSEYAGYHLDLGALETQLAKAPLASRGGDPVTIGVPSPDGELVEFAVSESPVMEPGLAAQHPEITTWAGRTTGDDALASIRLDVTPLGFHAAVRGPGAAWYVDPAYLGDDQGDDALYLSYRGDDLPADDAGLAEPDLPGLEAAAERARERVAQNQRIGEGPGAVAVQRSYRLALATDPSYADYFDAPGDSAAQINAKVTAAKVTLVNRINVIYNADLSVNLVLVANNDRLNFNTAAQFSGANGACGSRPCYDATNDADCNGLAIDTNRYVIGQLIGAENYDLGHIAFGPDGDGGGVAYLGSVGTYYKAGGCTGLTVPTGDGFALDYVAHEMGHQMGGEHTFNGVTGSCAGNTSDTSSVEPGSGSSIMAYAGICGIDNLQPHTDPYFSQQSQEEIEAVVTADPLDVDEVQSVGLQGWSSGDSLTLTYPGLGTTAPITFSGYSKANIQNAVQAVTGGTVTADGYFNLDENGDPITLTAQGFSLTFSGAKSGVDIVKPTVNVAAGTFTSVVGTTDQGGVEGNRGTTSSTTNRNPTVTAPAARTIPIRTPFELTGSAVDPDGDALVYLWEQNDEGPVDGVVLNTASKPTGPLFRVFGAFANVTNAGTQQYNSPGLNVAGASPTRTFPDMAQIVAGATNQGGTCPALTGTGGSETNALKCWSEFLPTAARSMKFRLTARDLGGANGGTDGGTESADVTITAAGTTPFSVTSQGSASSFAGGSTGTVTWNNAGTTAAPYSTANVKISFSTDGGLTYPTVLVASTPNSGSASVTWPSTTTTTGRVKVEAVGNYFFDINDAAITLTTPVGATLTTGGNASGATFTAPSSDPLDSTPTITASASAVDGTAISMTPAGLPAGLSLGRTTSSSAGTRPGTTTFTVTGTADVDPGSYPVTVTVSDGAGNAADTTVSFTVVVSKDVATLTYSGDTAATATSSGTDVVAVTVSTSVVDGDATPGTPAGTVAFADQTTGEALCSAPVTAGAASCTFGADVTGTSRTYQVVGTLTSARYTGASAPAPLVVTVTPPATLTTGGNASGATFNALSSDPLDSTPTITASASAVDGTAISMTPSGLPSGLTLGRTTSSAAGVRPGTTTFTVTGTADVDPGSYPVTVTVSDGAGNAADTTVSFTVVVGKDTASLTYTGDTSATAPSTGNDVVTVTVSTTVVDSDATPGTPAGSVAFTDQATGEALCSSLVSGGAASCTFGADLAGSTRTYQVVGTLTSTRYTGASTATPLVVAVVASPTLTTGGNADGGTFNAPSSDPLDTTPFVTASSNSVDGDQVTMTIAGLPGGLGLTRTASSDDGVRPGTTRFDVTGTATDDPGTYPVTVTVSDGPGGAADQSVFFTVKVVKDTATLTYTGATSATAPASGNDVVTVTVSATVVDDDATPGTPSGTVTFTDQTTSTFLCSAPVTAGAASCSFGADVPGSSRTYQVVATLASNRYAGSSAPTALDVTVVPPTLTTGGNTGSGPFGAASSDALGTTPFVTASSNTVDGDQVTMNQSGLPTGLSLARTSASADGVRPGTTRFDVTGTVNADAGSYPVTVTVSDGAGNAADEQVTFTVTVTKDAATVTYTGDTALTAPSSGTDVATATVSATVVDPDATPAAVTGSVVFTDQTTSEQLCTAPVTAGAASCTFGADVPGTSRTYQVVATLTSNRYTGDSAASPLVVTVDPGDTTPPQTTITGGPGRNSFALGDKVTFTYTSSEAGSTFTCSYGTVTRACPASGLTLTKPRSGSYDFSVIATDTSGNADASPAVRRFHVPVDDRALKVVKGPWAKKTSSSTFRGTYLQVSRKGSEVSYRITSATTLAVVLSKGPRMGGVDVYLGKKLLRSIAATGPSRTKVISAVARFKNPTSGLVRIVSRSGNTVQLDGLGVRSVVSARVAAPRNIHHLS